MNLWRTTIVQGGETYAWLKKLPDGVALTASLNGTALPLRSWVRYPQWYTPSVQTAFQVPATSSPGDYTLDGKTIKVIAPSAPRPLVTLQPGDGIQAALATGKDVLLAPGRHELPHRLDLASGCTVRGSGRDCTYLVRLPDGDYAERMIGPAPFATVSDLTLVNAHENAYAFHRYPDPAENVTVERVRFQGGKFGEFASPGLLIRDCEFDRCGLEQLTSYVLVHRCRFHHANISTWGSDSLALIDCELEGGSFVGSSHRGPVVNGLYSGLQFHGVQGRDNGSEVFLLESADFRDNLVMGFRARGGEGCGIQIWESHAVNNLFHDFVIDGGGWKGLAIWFYSTAQHDQSGNLFQCGELRGGRVDFGQRATGNVLRNVGFVSPRPGRGNQLGWYDPAWYAPQTLLKAAPGTNNRAESCPVIDMPCGWTLAENVALA